MNAVVGTQTYTINEQPETYYYAANESHSAIISQLITNKTKGEELSLYEVRLYQTNLDPSYRDKLLGKQLQIVGDAIREYNPKFFPKHREQRILDNIQHYSSHKVLLTPRSESEALEDIMLEKIIDLDYKRFLYIKNQVFRYFRDSEDEDGMSTKPIEH